LIDPKTQSRYKFHCNEWIYPSDEKLFNLSDSPQSIPPRKASTSSKSSSSSSIQRKRVQPSPKAASRSSSSSSYDVPKRYGVIQKIPSTEPRRISTDNESVNQKNKIPYRITIYPSVDDHGEFNALNNSRIFVRLNNQTKDSFIYKKESKYCPSFESGENQTFEINLGDNTNDKPMKLAIGYYNSDIAAGKWKLQKVEFCIQNISKANFFLLDCFNQYRNR
jgi:hypothetical protein